MISESLSNSILSALFGNTNSVTFPGAAYLGISMSKPADDGTGFSEPDPETTGYERKLIGKVGMSDVTHMAISTEDNNKEKHKERSITNIKMIMMNMMLQSAPSDGIYYGLFSAAKGGTPYAWGKLKDPVSLAADRVVVFKVNDLMVTLTDEEAITASATE